MAEKVLR